MGPWPKLIPRWCQQCQHSHKIAVLDPPLEGLGLLLADRERWSVPPERRLCWLCCGSRSWRANCQKRTQLLQHGHRHNCFSTATGWSTGGLPPPPCAAENGPSFVAMLRPGSTLTTSTKVHNRNMAENERPRLGAATSEGLLRKRLQRKHTTCTVDATCKYFLNTSFFGGSLSKQLTQS